MTEAHSTTSWLHSLMPTSASWGMIAAELAVLFFLLAILFAWFARRGRKLRIQAASELLADRDDMADTATQTMAMHLKALLSGQDPSDADLVDYNKRSRKLIGALCQPWLEPSKGALRDAAHQILAIRHTDLHQFAGILGSPLVKESEETRSALESTRQELVEVKKAEALRSKQLQEALTTIGTMVAEYGRKFEASTDSRTGQVLRALIYLQALDEGNDPERAKKIVDETLSEHLEALSDQEKDQAPPKPDSAAVAAAAAAEAADLSTELDAEAEMMAAMDEEKQAKSEAAKAAAKESAVTYDDDFDDLESIESATDTADVEPVVEAAAGNEQTEEEPAGTTPEAALPETPSMGELDALDDIDALITQAQSKITEKSKATTTADEIEIPPAPKPPAEDNTSAAANRQPDANLAKEMPASTATETEIPLKAPDAKPQAEPATTKQVAKPPAAAKSAEPTVDVPASEADQAAEEAEMASKPQDESPEDEDDNEVVDLDEVELPKKAAQSKADADPGSIADDVTAAADNFDLDLDDIDALLDAEIARHQNPASGGKPDEEDLDLSKP